MLVRFLSYLGKEGFGEQFYGEYELGGETLPCTIRWAAEPRGGLGKDNPLARVRDAGLLMQLYPDPIVPRVLAVVPCWNGLAVVSEAPEGVKLAELEQRPLPEGVILEIVRQISGMLDRVYTRKDANTGEMLRTMHRAINTECVHVRADGSLRVTGFEKMSTVWSARAAETSALATHPGARLAPEQMAGEVFHATDVYLTGVLAVDLLVNPERASQTARMLAMCICDPEGFEEIREQILSDDSVEATTNLRGLLRAMLQEDPKSRPSAHIITNMAAAVGASQPALRDWAATLEMAPPPEGLFHQFGGRTLELPDPELRPFPSDDEEDIEEATDVGAVADLQPAAPPMVEAEAQPEEIAAESDAGDGGYFAPSTPAAAEEPSGALEPEPAPVPTPTPTPQPVTPPPPPAVASVTPASVPPVAVAVAVPEPELAPEPEPVPAPEVIPEPAPIPEPEPVVVEPYAVSVAPVAPVAAEEPSEALDPELGAPMPQPIKPGKAPPLVDQALAPKPVEPITSPEAPFEPPAPVEDSELDAPKKRSKLPLIIGIVVLLGLLGAFACGGGFLLFLLL